MKRFMHSVRVTIDCYSTDMCYALQYAAGGVVMSDCQRRGGPWPCAVGRIVLGEPRPKGVG